MTGTGKEPGTFIIAEAGVNHNGQLDIAQELIQAAADAGADAVKFQTFSADKLVLKGADKAEYQTRNTGSDRSQYEMLKALELAVEEQLELRACCDAAGIEFMSSPFDPESLEFLVNEIGVTRLKIPSGEVVNGLLLLPAIRSGRPLILSTGMCTLDDVLESLSILAWGHSHASGVPPSRDALAALRAQPDWSHILKGRVSLLQCVTMYPAPASATNLRAIGTLADLTGLPVGLSDHSEGWHIPVAAVAVGARLIEKHFTLSRRLPGPDHLASLEPDELALMVRQIRDVESALGNGKKIPTSEEIKNREPARGSVVAARAIALEHVLEVDDLSVKRPGNGVSPFALWDIYGQRAHRAYQQDDPIELKPEET